MTNIKIIHLAQTHAYPFGSLEQTGLSFGEREELLTQIAQSQLAIAQHIKQNYPGYPLVIEGLSSTCENPNDSIRADVLTHIKNIFPTGLPEPHENLSPEQKMAFYKHGAGIILFVLGELSIIYRATKLNTSPHAELSQLVSPKSPRSFLTHLPFYNYFRLRNVLRLNTPREEQAIECVIEANDLHYSRTAKQSPILLLFGAAHNFKQYHGQRYSTRLQDFVNIETATVNFSARLTFFNQLVARRYSETLEARASVGVIFCMVLAGCIFSSFGVGLAGAILIIPVSAIIGYMAVKIAHKIYHSIGNWIATSNTSRNALVSTDPPYTENLVVSSYTPISQQLSDHEPTGTRLTTINAPAIRQETTNEIRKPDCTPLDSSVASPSFSIF